MSIRDNYAAMTVGPGKFEGDPAYVPYFHDQWTNGWADEEGGDINGLVEPWAGFQVTADDRALFPELTAYAVIVFERGDGFVTHCEYPDRAAFDRALASLEQMEASDD